MTISLITATYNSARTLADTLESIKGQKGVDYEVLVQDGGSRDETLAIAGSYPFAEILSEPDGGLYNAMNRGVTRARGEIVGILNSDDFYPSDDILLMVAEAFAADPLLDAVYGDLYYVGETDTKKIIRKWRAKPYQYDRWRLGWMPPHPTFFVRKTVYERFGGFNEILRFAADYEFMLRCCYRHKISVRYLPKVLVHMRAGGVSNSTFRNRLRANREDIMAWRLNGLVPPPGLNLLKPLRKLRQWL